MNNEVIYEEKYKNCLIKIYQDTDYSDTAMYEDNTDVFLVHYHRDLSVKRDSVITEEDVEKWYNGEKIEQLKDYFIFAVSAYIHSGISLSLNSSFVGDSGGWDTSHVGCVLISKKEYKTREKAIRAAESLIERWNDDLSGNVYGFIAEDEYGNNIDSCWGFYGDYDKSGIIDEAKGAINYYVKEKLPEVKKQIARDELYTRHNVNLLDLKNTDNQTIKRIAMSLISLLKIK